TIRIPDDCPADVNRDGVLNDSDFFAWVTVFIADPRTPEQTEQCDVNLDGACDDSDFFAWVTEFISGGCD
ncbi:MAG: GC-type dockerin domain-anchored protein, partial [Planctomycetota bacterium]